MSKDVQVRSYNGSVPASQLLSGKAQTLAVDALGAQQDAVIAESGNQLVAGAVTGLGKARVRVLGAGTAQVGVKVLGLLVALDAAYPVVLVADAASGRMSLVFPQGAPGLLSAAALVVTAGPVNYAFPDGILCFAAGTRISTLHGEIAVEDIRPNQRVLTLDRGARPVISVLERRLALPDLDERPNLYPVCIPAGAFGPNNPCRDLVLSPQHRLMIDSPRAEGLFGHRQVLVAVLHLVGCAGVHVMRPATGVRYIHLLLARHELIRAEGCVSESFYLGPEGMRGLDSAARAQIGRSGLTRMHPARPLLRKADARHMVEQMLAAGEPLQQADYDWAGAAR